MVVRINSKRAVLARWTLFAVEFERAFEVVGSTLWTRADRLPRVNTKFRAAAQTQMIGVIPDAPSQSFVIRVMGILLLALLIDVVRIAVRPGNDGVSALVADVLNCLRHSGSLCGERGIKVKPSPSNIVPEVPA